MKVSLALLFFSCVLFAENTKLIRSCKVYDKVSRDAKVNCTLKAGDNVVLAGKVDERISEVSSLSCKGFLYTSCLDLPKTEHALEKRAQDASKFRVGFSLEGEGPIASIPSSSLYSKGLGFGLGAMGQYKIFQGLSILALPAYRFQRLSRSIDGSGSLRDPNPSSYSQSVWNISLGLSVSANIFEFFGKRELANPWTVKLGGEVLLPTSATQTDSNGSEESFESSKMVNLVFGTGIEFPLMPRIGLLLNGDVFYHVTARDSNQLYGIRVGASGVFAL